MIYCLHLSHGWLCNSSISHKYSVVISNYLLNRYVFLCVCVPLNGTTLGVCLNNQRLIKCCDNLWLNTLRPRQNGRRFADDTLKRIFLIENIRISTKNPLKFVPKGLINNIPALVLIMAWRRPGDKPLSEPMMVSLLTHICVARPQWVKGLLPDALFLLLRFLFQISPDLKKIKSFRKLLKPVCPHDSLHFTSASQLIFMAPSMTSDVVTTGILTSICSGKGCSGSNFSCKYLVKQCEQHYHTSYVILSKHVYNKDISKAKDKITVTVTKYFHDD